MQWLPRNVRNACRTAPRSGGNSWSAAGQQKRPNLVSVYSRASSCCLHPLATHRKALPAATPTRCLPLWPLPPPPPLLLLPSHLVPCGTAAPALLPAAGHTHAHTAPPAAARSAAMPFALRWVLLQWAASALPWAQGPKPWSLLGAARLHAGLHLSGQPPLLGGAGNEGAEQGGSACRAAGQGGAGERARGWVRLRGGQGTPWIAVWHCACGAARAHHGQLCGSPPPPPTAGVSADLASPAPHLPDGPSHASGPVPAVCW